MSPWNIITEIRRRISEEEGVLRKEAAFRVALCHPPVYGCHEFARFPDNVPGNSQHPGAGAERAFLPEKSRGLSEAPASRY